MSVSDKKPWSDKVALPVRSAIQLGLAGAIVEVVDSTIWDMSDRQYGAILALLTIALSVVQNGIEAKTGTALIKADPVEPVATVVPVQRRDGQV